MLVYLAVIEDEKGKIRFRTLFDKYERLLYAVAYKILRDEKDAEDAVQEAFFALAKNISRVSDVSANKIRSYLIIIVRNEALKIYNARRKESGAALNADIYGTEDCYPGLSPLASAISRLPDDCKELILLKYDNGFTSKEIARMLGTSDGAVRQKLLKAKVMLKKELEKEGEEV